MSLRRDLSIVAALALCGFAALCQAGTIHEGFEGGASIFNISSSNSCIGYNEDYTAFSHSGNECLYIDNSCCGASCFQANRCDLFYYPESPLQVSSISFWAREGSSSGSGWGGSISAMVDGVGVGGSGIIGNGQSITGQWQYVELAVDMEVVDYIRIWEHDITSRTSMWIDDIQIHTAETADANPLVTGFELSAAYPNPFNPSTTLRYSLPETMDVELGIFSLTGERVATLFSGLQPAGEGQIQFDAGALPAGLYLAVLQSAEHSQCQKLLLVK